MRFFNVFFLLFLIGTQQVVAQLPVNFQRPSDTLNKEPFVNTVDQSVAMYFKELIGEGLNYDSIQKALNYSTGQIPEFTDAQICEQLEEFNRMSPFQLDCNQNTLGTIRFFMKNRRSFISIVMGRSELYFDLFEEKLAEYGLPLELKFLPVIESGLRPQVKSKAGALGLWQFMYRTGQSYGLKENSYIDERMDPALATDAACRFLKKLYGIYGDWNLCLAAYNAGPGNVNKAIHRSGNKKTYWEVRPFLPTETQGYVPNFIAAAYLITYHTDHNIRPSQLNLNYNLLDTVCLKKGVYMSTISRVVQWDEEEVKKLNPVYKTGFIPQTNPPQCISGPLEKIGVLVSLEDTLYQLEAAIFATGTTPIAPVVPIANVPKDTLSANGLAKTQFIYHTVKAGETMTAIATKYQVSVDSVLLWNDLQTANIYVGQRLKINGISKAPAPPAPPVPPVTKKYYTVRSGDTFGKIADRHNVSQTTLKKLNPSINISRLQIGQRIRVK
ncbi:MAG: LysM peptidoglycan-binding domain-containing protein [Bacteroidota bacterium]